MKKILFLLFAFAIVANLSAGNRKKAVLYGDGVHDDTEAIQSMLDSRSTQVKLPIPTKYYVISRPLVIYSNQELLLDRYTTVFLADSSNCYMQKQSISFNIGSLKKHVSEFPSIFRTKVSTALTIQKQRLFQLQ